MSGAVFALEGDDLALEPIAKIAKHLLDTKQNEIQVTIVLQSFWQAAHVWEAGGQGADGK